MTNYLSILPNEVLIQILNYVGQPQSTAPVSKDFSEVTDSCFFYLKQCYLASEQLKTYCLRISNSANLTDKEFVRAVYNNVLGEAVKINQKLSPRNVAQLEQIALETHQRKEKDLLKIVAAIEKQYPQIPAYKGSRSDKELEKQAGKWMSDNVNTVINLDLTADKLHFLSSLIGNLTNLQILYLCYNRLESIPSALGNLTNLQELYLSDNKLKSIPAGLANLINLKILSLTGNQLQRIPPEISNLTNLQKLFLSGNQLQSIPKELGNLINLQKLFLNRNLLQSIPTEIGKLTNLKELLLNDNQLQSISTEIAKLVNLQELYLFGNPLKSIPDEIFKLPHLRKYK